METLNFIPAKLQRTLELAKYSQESTNIPNNHKVIPSETLQLWTDIAQGLGIAIADTEYTLRVSYRNGEVQVYTPYIGSNGDEAVLVWGKVQQPLSKIPKETVELALATRGARPMMDCYLSAFNDSILVSLMITKDSELASKEVQEYHKLDADGKITALRRAFRSGNLHTYLSKSFTRAAKLGAIAGQTVQVTSYALNRFGKYELETSAGLVSGNTAIARRLDNAPVITPEYPATLTVGQSTSTTSSGHPIYPLTLTTHEDENLEVFVFGEPENTSEDLDFF